MNKNLENIDELIVRQLTDSLSTSDQSQLDSWLDESVENKTYYDQVVNIWKDSDKIKAFDTVNVLEDYSCFAKKVGFVKERNLITNRFLRFRNVAAMLLPLLSISIVLALYYTTSGFGKWVAHSTDKHIEQISLPDQSLVDLNAFSSLRYQKSFDGAERLLKLEGEGYFKVSKNPDKPFVVNVGQTVVKVLGTAFYLEENKKNDEVTLLVTEGKVLFSSDKQKIELVKNEGAIYSNGKITKFNALPINKMAWRTGLIEFKKANLDEVIKTMLDYFSEIEEVDNQSESIDRVITTKFTSPGIEEVLVELRIHFDKNFTLDGNKLIISD